MTDLIATLTKAGAPILGSIVGGLLYRSVAASNE